MDEITLEIVSPDPREIPLEKMDGGFWQVVVDNVPPGAQYYYKFAGGIVRPDPASHFQPEGVQGTTEVVDHGAFPWTDQGWRGIPLDKYVIYELHVGTFTPEGTFDAIIPRLAELKDLGVSALEIMPVAQFPGERNWGYDGVYPFAVQNSYGGPDGLKRLIDACHKEGLAVVLDVVYNHLGPEGNYLGEFGPYFNERYRTLWGGAINMDSYYSYGVRNYFFQNALHWFRHFHFDALRLDAIQGIIDLSAKHFLAELDEKVEQLSRLIGRKFYLIAESDLNDVRVIMPQEAGGYGLEAQWLDDWHHAVYTILTGQRYGYYVDFGEVSQLLKSFREGFIYNWEYSPSRKRCFGSSSVNRPARKFVVFLQNHDQVGNGLEAGRLSKLLDFEGLKLAAGLLFLSPYIPLLFMGEEYGEDTPFMYFVSFSDPNLIQAVREGRKMEFKAIEWEGHVPDPEAVETFEESRIQWDKRYDGSGAVLLAWYKELIRLRRTTPCLVNLDNKKLKIGGHRGENVIYLHRWHSECRLFCLFNLNRDQEKTVTVQLEDGGWYRLLDSAEERWDGPGSATPEELADGMEVTLRPSSLALYVKEIET